jgi:hypothetical protein
VPGEGHGSFQGLGKWGERKKSGKNTREQASSYPAFACVGEEGE